MEGLTECMSPYFPYEMGVEKARGMGPMNMVLEALSMHVERSRGERSRAPSPMPFENEEMDMRLISRVRDSAIEVESPYFLSNEKIEMMVPDKHMYSYPDRPLMRPR